MVDFSVDTSALRRRIARRRKQIKDLRPFFAGEATDIIYAEIRRAFLSRGYGSWSPLSPAYAIRKAKERPGKGLLRYDDTYFKAATKKSAFGSVYRVSRRGLVIDVNENLFPGEYPALHEEGTSRLPARPVFGLVRPRVRRDVRRALGNYLFRQRPRSPQRQRGVR